MEQTPAQRAPSTNGTNERSKAVRRVLLVTMGLNAAVALAKVVYGLISESLAIRADGFHSLTDAGNNIVGLVGISIAARPADPEHPYGHHKFEIVAAGFVGLSLLVMAYDVARGAITRLFSPSATLPQIGWAAFVILLVTFAVNFAVARYERREGQRLLSPFLESDAVHTQADVWVTVGVTFTALMVWLGYPVLDAATAIGLSGFIAYSGVRVLLKNLNYLADRAMLDKEQIRHVVLGVPGVASTHKIRTRGTPGVIHVDLHIQIAPHLNVVDAHRVTHWVIDAIKAEYPTVLDVLVHTEPAKPDQPYKPLPN